MLGAARRRSVALASGAVGRGLAALPGHSRVWVVGGTCARVCAWGSAALAAPGATTQAWPPSRVLAPFSSLGGPAPAPPAASPPPSPSLLPPPPPASPWSESSSDAPLDPTQRVFCNRSLNMRDVTAVGFDMDYTLAQYLPETFERLAHDETAKKLVEAFGYPRKLLSYPFDPSAVIRGLLIDKRRGNVLKADRHGYVKLAYHGSRRLSREERRALYNGPGGGGREALTEPNYAPIDTLFSLGEASLFMRVVDLAENDPTGLPTLDEAGLKQPGAAAAAAAEGEGSLSGAGGVGSKNVSFLRIYRDIRGAVDLCHRDGSIKRKVAEDPSRYVHRDDALVQLLASLRASGKKVFLATNSLWDYTNVVLTFLLDGELSDEARRKAAWLRHFDAVLTGTAKPRFFAEPSDLFVVDEATGLLANTQGGAPTIPLDRSEMLAGLGLVRGGEGQYAEPLDEDFRTRAALGSGQASRDADADDADADFDERGGWAPGVPGAPDSPQASGPPLGSRLSGLAEGEPGETGAPAAPARAKVYQGGWYADLHRMLGVKSGSQVLYVGDHIYGDVLRSKRDLGWRTVLVIPELQAELACLREHGPGAVGRLRHLRTARDAAEDALERLRWKSARDAAGDADEGTGGAAAGAGEGPPARELDRLEGELAALKREHSTLLASYNACFHPVWGQLLKTGYQNSRYAHQIERYACLYTSHIGNLASYSPNRAYQARLDVMAHEEDPDFEAASGLGNVAAADAAAAAAALARAAP